VSVTKVILPKLGLTMDEGAIAHWHKHEGDRVTAGEALFECETDKVNMDVEAVASGYLRKVIVQEGVTVPVATTVGYISDTADEPLPE
jgi:pyruvate/2-oxoglutarate dehydrogenase complex dihydrolipoamide acyltransferase (E2) component